MERRKFIQTIGTAAVVTPIIGSYSALATNSVSTNSHEFPQLPYAYNALEPYIDAQTMELHYSKHFKGYYTKFLEAAEGTDLLTIPLEQIFAGISKQSDAIRNNGGGYYNHALFWESMTPTQNAIPSSLEKSLIENFGSLETFKKEFGNAAKTRFGSGWAWLIADKSGKLQVTSTANQDNPLMDIASTNGTPLLALDVWEHAYYLKYQNKRADYVDNFWNIVNWDQVNSRLSKA